MGKQPDFRGWATRANVRCSDGRTIMPDAFKECDGQIVPLVWSHQHNDIKNVLGHVLLESRNGDVYAYGFFNDSPDGQDAKARVKNGDIRAMSIWANKLQQRGSDVLHGIIREVSLVLAGANPEAYIEEVMAHGDGTDPGVVIYFDQPLDYEIEEPMAHSDATEKKEEIPVEENPKPETAEKKETLEDIFNTLSDKQKDVVYVMIGDALEKAGITVENDDNNNKEDNEMKHNVFDPETKENNDTLSHDALNTILADGKRCGSLKESFLAHADEYGIKDIDVLFPEAKSLTPTPDFIKRDTGWVAKVMNGAYHTPFSRIKSVFADITEDEARAKGYMKGNLKKEEVFSLLKRSTTPTTVYKKQKMDRDDRIDITGFDVIAWLKGEMRLMLDEELARASLIGDGRLASSDDKINEGNIRPIYNDADLFTIKAQVNVAHGATDDAKATAFIKRAIKERKNYQGSGNPTLFTTEDMLTDMLLLTDSTGRDLYADEAALARKLRVKEIVTVPVMENMKGAKGGDLMGIIVNMTDYAMGADRGGAVSMFEDFDIDYNQQKYLIETRMSGALRKPYSAIALELNEAAS